MHPEMRLKSYCEFGCMIDPRVISSPSLACKPQVLMLAGLATVEP